MARAHPGNVPTASKGEILYAHDPTAGPVTALRNIIIQSSLTQLQTSGYYARYVDLIPPAVLEELLSSLGPGWTPIRLADAHYGACEALRLTPDEMVALGTRVGDKLQEAAFVTAAKKAPRRDFDIWAELGSMHRTWARLYQGGSVQGTKIGPKALLLELRGFTLYKYGYYRNGALAAMGSTFSALGVTLESAKIVSCDDAGQETVIRVTW